jgi:hypothetical protein
LWQLRSALEAKRVRQIDDLLVLDSDQALAALYEQRSTCLEIMQPFEKAMNRSDSTMPEMIFLAQIHQRNARQIRKSLAAEKEILERKRRPGDGAKGQFPLVG